jgi:hypothetical protein
MAEKQLKHTKKTRKKTGKEEEEIMKGEGEGGEALSRP